MVDVFQAEPRRLGLVIDYSRKERRLFVALLTWPRNIDRLITRTENKHSKGNSNLDYTAGRWVLTSREGNLRGTCVVDVPTSAITDEHFFLI